jgi:hypothetical protein
MILIIFVPENSAVEASVVILILMLLAVGKYWKKNMLSMKIPRIILKSLYIDGKKFHQYQQNEEAPLTFTH